MAGRLKPKTLPARNDAAYSQLADNEPETGDVREADNGGKKRIHMILLGVGILILRFVRMPPLAV